VSRSLHASVRWCAVICRLLCSLHSAHVRKRSLQTEKTEDEEDGKMTGRNEMRSAQDRGAMPLGLPHISASSKQEQRNKASVAREDTFREIVNRERFGNGKTIHAIIVHPTHQLGNSTANTAACAKAICLCIW